MPGASHDTTIVKNLNANWTPAADGADGRFELQLITEDGERHVLLPSPAATATLVALAQADTVLAWDPANRTLIAANVVGEMPWTRRA